MQYAKDITVFIKNLGESGVRPYSPLKDKEKITLLLNSITLSPYVKNNNGLTKEEIKEMKDNEVTRLSANEELDLDNINFKYYYVIKAVKSNGVEINFNFSSLQHDGQETQNCVPLDDERNSLVNTFASEVDKSTLLDVTGASHGEIWTKLLDIYTEKKATKGCLPAIVHIEHVKDVYTILGKKVLNDNGQYTAVLGKKVWLQF